MWRALEERRRAEVSALEWKLRETRRRHIEELSRLASASSTEYAWAAPANPPQEPRPRRRLAGASLCASSSAGHLEGSGPVVVSLKKDYGAHRIRLWVEDLACFGSARIHALDEATGARSHRDIPDAALSKLLTAYKRSPSCDPDDVDEFLRALLRACKIQLFPQELNIIISPPTPQDLHPEARPAPLSHRVMQHVSAMSKAGRPIRAAKMARPEAAPAA
ncbi:unnamed protein product, partial [Effrenium voratum]